MHMLHSFHQWYLQNVRIPVAMRWSSWRLRHKYKHQLKRIRGAFQKRPLRVLFPISSLAKWKMQTIFDLMRHSTHYEPIVALTVFDIESRFDKNEKERAIAAVKAYCIERQMPYVDAYETETGRFLSFKCFEPDIVWYQDPWDIDKCQSPKETANFALTCYVPYFVQNYGYLLMDCLKPFHRHIWRHFTLNAQWAAVFMEEQDRTGKRAGEVVGLGHPMLDQFAHLISQSNEKLVIYAPHFSCGIDECYSTFLEYGEKILRYAQKHPEIKWAFKPHPTLRHVLIHILGHSEKEVNAYYSAWEKIGEVYLSGDYVRLFERSYALLTDCASFLIEYACTEKPIIRLVPHAPKFLPHPISRQLFSTYYNANNWCEICEYLDRIVIHGDDFRQEERLAQVKQMNLHKNDAAKSIVSYLSNIFEGNSK